jgi:ABC-type uncharacterized transport system involved in gliding motility auxiliary subunit
MKTDLRRFAPIGLWVALAALIASAVLYFVQRQFTLALQICLALIPLGVAAFVLMDPERVRQWLTGRQARYGSNALVLTLSFIGILVVVNYLVVNNSKSWDLTEGKQNTLAPESINTLGQLNQPVAAVAFFTTRMPSQDAKDLLEKYKQAGNGKFSYKFIDPESDPVAARQANIVRDGTIVLVMGDRQEPVTTASEQEVTGAMVRLLNPSKKVIYFLSGHGERDIEQPGDQSYSTVRSTLESKNYTVKSLNLLVDNKIPDDANVIVVAGPQKPLQQSEVDMLKQFSNKGGGLLVLSDPPILTQSPDSQDPLADYINSSWGVKLNNDLVVDPSSQQPSVAIAAKYGTSPITARMQNMVTVYPTVRSTTVTTQTIDGVSPVELVLTGPQAWGETNLEGLKKNPPDVAQGPGDLPGPVTIANSAENFNTKGRIVVFGGSTFATDINYGAYGNGDMIINSIDWTAGEEQLINLTPKQQVNRALVPPQASTMNLLALLTVIVIPGIALVAGIAVWVRRRSRG